MSEASVWLTRPLNQVTALQQSLDALAIKTFHLPLLEIEALEESAAIKARILNLDQYDLAIFISTNAARLGLHYIDRYWPQYPAGLENFALGPATAKVLHDYGLAVHYPAQAMSSEAVLALPQLEQALNARSHARVLIFRGEGGRELLAGKLRESGAEVDYIELYRRKVPAYPQSVLEAALDQNPPDCIIITSKEALDNFTQLFAPLQRDIYNIPLLVSSPRIGQAAGDAGFRQINVMPGASDKVIIEHLQGQNYE